jgi:hypothetical protein
MWVQDAICNILSPIKKYEVNFNKNIYKVNVDDKLINWMHSVSGINYEHGGFLLREKFLISNFYILFYTPTILTHLITF